MTLFTLLYRQRSAYNVLHRMPVFTERLSYRFAFFQFVFRQSSVYSGLR